LETPSWIGLLRLFPLLPLPVFSWCWRLLRELLGPVSAIRFCSSNCSCCWSCCCCCCWAGLPIKPPAACELCRGKLCKLSALHSRFHVRHK
jgi:hypothetical protein